MREQQLAAMRAITSNDHFSPNNGQLQPSAIPEAPKEEVDHDSAAFVQQVQAATTGPTQLNLSQAMQRGQKQPGPGQSSQGQQMMGPPASPSVIVTPRPPSRHKPPGSYQEKRQEDNQVREPHTGKWQNRATNVYLCFCH